MKTAVVYYSLEGDTELVARLIAERTGADLIRVKPAKDVPTDGAQKFLRGGFGAIFSTKPKLSQPLPDLNIYDTVFVGTPVWAGHCSPAIRSALSDGHIYGKDVYLFACCGSSAGKCLDDLRGLLPGNSVKGTMDFVNANKIDSSELENKINKFCSRITGTSGQAE